MKIVSELEQFKVAIFKLYDLYDISYNEYDIENMKYSTIDLILYKLINYLSCSGTISLSQKYDTVIKMVKHIVVYQYNDDINFEVISTGDFTLAIVNLVMKLAPILKADDTHLINCIRRVLENAKRV